jgi:hypothetical protein
MVWHHHAVYPLPPRTSLSHSGGSLANKHKLYHLCQAGLSWPKPFGVGKAAT